MSGIENERAGEGNAGSVVGYQKVGAGANWLLPAGIFAPRHYAGKPMRGFFHVFRSFASLHPVTGN
jgi:hypothetical protein